MKNLVSVIVLSLAALVPATVVAQSDSIPFRAPDTILGVSGAWSVVAADFDGDGLPDIIAGSQRDAHFYFLKGDGHGHFAAPVTSAAGENFVYSIAVADFDGNGTEDLAIASWPSIEIFLNDGSANFADTGRYKAAPAEGPATYKLIAVDCNKDGKPDLVGSNFNTGNISVLLNKGAGLFDTAVTYASGVNTYTVCSGDFDGDGNVDLAATNISSSNFSTFKGHGDGTFDAAVHVSCWTSPEAICAADFDRDGDLDLAISIITLNAIDIYQNDGSGIFTFARRITANPEPRTIIAEDLDRDGILDLATSCIAGSGSLCVVKGKANGTFAAATKYESGAWSQSVCGADFDGDNDTDLVVANYNSNDLTYYENLSPAPASVDGPSGNNLPRLFSLAQNCPNPFNPTTKIRFELPQRADVTVEIYNILGETVTTIHAGVLAAGSHELTWDGRSDIGLPVSSGVYLYNLKAGENQAIRKMVLLK
jgi:hypothetical protein